MKVLPVLEAIRQRCLFCVRDNVEKVDNCGVRSCALWPYRMGTMPEVRTKARNQGNQGEARSVLVPQESAAA